MRTTRGGTGLGGNGPEYPIDKNEARKIYLEHFELAMIANKEKDHLAFDKHYRIAEHYQKLMNRLDACSAITPGETKNAIEVNFSPYNWRQFILKSFVFEPKDPE